MTLTPLQREVERPPTCSRCGHSITALVDLYRCAQCDAAFDLSCIKKHFGWSVNDNPHPPSERVDPDPETPLQKLAAALHALNIPTWDYGRMRDLHDPSDQTGCWDLHLEQAEAILAEWSDPSVKGPSDE